MSTLIQATVNYDLFTRILSNREINKTHLSRLKKSITAKNYLYLFPIIINANMEIVDGQHRLAAAMELKLPIFYMIDDRITKADIAMVNSNRKSWAAKDYIAFYAREGNDAYAKLQSLLEQYPKLTVIAGAKLIDNTSVSYDIQGGGQMSLKLKNGQVNAGDFDVAFEILKMAKKLLADYEWAFYPRLLLNFKNLIGQTSLSIEETLKTIYAKRDKLPSDLSDGENILTLLKTMVPMKERAKSKSPVRHANIKRTVGPPKKDIFGSKDELNADDFKENMF